LLVEYLALGLLASLTGVLLATGAAWALSVFVFKANFALPMAPPFVALVAVKVGPVSARFKGNLKLSNVVAPTRYTINFDGQGGVAGFGKGSADVVLAAEGEQTRLNYHAHAHVGGKMAQVGSRLVDAAASKVAEDFFKAFEAHLSPPEAVAPADTGQVPMPADTEKGNRALWWGVDALVVVLLLYFLMR